jgi:hypothetical protein
LSHIARVKTLCVEIPENADVASVYIKTILALLLPQVQHCVVTYRGGHRNVCLFSSGEFADLTADHLQTLHLTNCYITHRPNFFKQLSSAALSLGQCQLWAPQFTLIRHLVLWTCITGPHLASSNSDPLSLPLLETLSLVAPYPFGMLVADRLRYPTRCSVFAKFVFGNADWSEELGGHDAMSASIAASTLLSSGEKFEHCQLQFDECVLAVRLARSHLDSPPKTADLRFDVTRAIVAPDIVGFCRSLPDDGVLWSPRLLGLQNLTPTALFTGCLWDTLSLVLSEYLRNIVELSVAFSTGEPFGPAMLPTMQRPMKKAQILSFDSPLVFTTHASFLHDMRLSGHLRRVTIRLAVGQWTSEFKTGLAGWLQHHMDQGHDAPEIQFIISPAILQLRDLDYLAADLESHAVIRESDVKPGLEQEIARATHWVGWIAK